VLQLTVEVRAGRLTGDLLERVDGSGRSCEATAGLRWS